MTGKNDPDPGKAATFQTLRKRAEKKLAAGDKPFKDLSASEMSTLIHELQIHQVELEMQNEELRKSQAVTERSRKAYQDLWELSPVGHLMVDFTGRATAVNRAGLRLFGRPENALIKERFSKLVTPENQVPVHLMFERAVETGIVEKREIRILKPDGSNHICLLEVSSLGGEPGREQIQAVLTDITKQKRAEKVLEKERQRIFSVLDLIPAFLYLQVPDYTIAFANKKFYDLYGDPGDRHCYEILHGRKIPCEECHTFRVFETGSPQTWEWDDRKGTSYLIFDSLFTDSDDREMVLEFGLDITDLKKAEAVIRKLSHQLLSAKEIERRMISRELHDSIAQDLSAAKIGCDTLFDKYPEVSPVLEQKIAWICKILQNSIQVVRDLSYDLRPPRLSHIGLVKIISDYCEDFSEDIVTNIEFSSFGMDNLEFDSNMQINLYRFVQEGLNNVKKHADASQTTVRLFGSSQNIILTVEDNGKGFDVEKRMATIDNEKKMGLRNMEERAQLLGGRFNVQSSPGKGTSVMIEIPFWEKRNG